MANKKTHQSGGVNITRSTVHAGGDIVGRDKIVSEHSRSLDEAQLEQAFARIYALIDGRPDDPNLDKTELRETVGKIEEEVKKGNAANPKKIERWLRFLAGMADDVYTVTVATLTHPIAGIAKAIQLIAQRAEKEGA